MRIKQGDLRKMGDKEELNKAREYALKLLEYRERSEQEIRNRMGRKEYNQELINKTVRFLKDQNLLNDRRFAQIWAESRLRRSYGRWKVQADLNEKGVKEEIIEETLKELYSKVNETQMALDLIQKKWPSLSRENNPLLRRVSGFLERRGFSFEVITEIIRQVQAD